MAKREIEYLVLGGMMNNEYAISVALGSIDSSYFDDQSCRIIYQSFYNYYKKYSKIPSMLEMNQSINQNYIPLGPTQDEVISVNQQLMTLGGQVDEQYLIDNIESFIKNHRIEVSLKKAIDSYGQGGEVSLSKMASGLVDSLDFTLSRTGITQMSKIDEVLKSREDVMGSNGGSDKVIKSVFPKVNMSLTYKGYIQGSLSVIVAPPGCFTGDTRIMTLDGKAHTLEELYQNQSHIGIYSVGPDGDMAPGPADGIHLSGYHKDLIEVEIDGKYKIKSTLDHPYMTREGKYVEAQNLIVGQSLMPLRRQITSLDYGRNDNSKKSFGKYESITNGFNQTGFTHRMVAERFSERPEGYNVVNHLDKDKLNNYPSNLQWMKNISEHSKYHYDQGDYNEFVENGKATRYTSEVIRERNLANWKDSEYRNKMLKFLKDKYEKTDGEVLQKFNHNPEVQYNRRKMKVLSFVNTVISHFGKNNVTVNNYNDLAKSIDSKYHVWLYGIASAYDCLGKHSETNKKRFDIDYDKMSSVWSTVLDDASVYNHKVTKITLIHLDKEVPVYGIENASIYKNFTLALDEKGTEGVVVSNTGKTSIMVNEGAYAARQGFTVFHAFLGDMVEWDGFIRYSANITGETQEDLMKLQPDEIKNLVDAYTSKEQGNVFDRIDYKAWASSEITVDKLMSFITNEETKLGKHYDLIIVDYADNFATEGANSYSEMGDVYDKLLLFARQNHSAIITASQPKIAYWSQEIIPLEGAGDSSRKQHIVDMMVTFNKPSRNSTVGTLFLAKIRRGTTGDIVRAKLDMSRCRVTEISEDEYNMIRQQEVNAGGN